jgi:hypothetical protein
MATSQPFVTRQRINAQHLTNTSFSTPGDVLSWMGAIQAQDFAAAKWAISIRMKSSAEAEIEQAFNDGEILRTHILRPTWHFVHPKDIRWMLALTSPRVHAVNGYYYRQSGLDKSVFQKSNDIIAKVLKGGKQLTRTELNDTLLENKIPTQKLGLSFTIMQAELDGIICSGPRKGKQFTYMLLDERVPATSEITRDEALVELTKRYFQSHGPAQMQDFVWWSSLTVAEAKKGIENSGLKKEVIDNKTYWYVKKSEESNGKTAFLLPPFDEYFVAYKNKSDILDERYKKHMNFGGGMISGAILISGVVVGTWKRTLRKDGVIINLQPFTKFTDSELELVKEAADKYGSFLSAKVTIV